MTSTRLAVAVVAVVVGTVFALLAFTRDDGSSTPEAAAQQLFEAIVANDAIGVLESLPPGERKALRGSAIELIDQLRRLGLLGAFDERQVPGASLKVEGLKFHTIELGDDAMAVEVIAGTFAVSVDPANYPFTDRFRSILGQAFDVAVGNNAETFTRDFGVHSLRLVAIREGGWHISAGYSFAESIRTSHRVDIPEFGKGPPAIGSDNPEAAVRDLFKAYADADPERAITVMYPDEARALYDYAPSFLPQAKAAADEGEANGTYQAQLNDLKLEVEGSGVTRRVRVDGLDIDIRDDVHKTHISFGNGCYQVDYRFADTDDPFDVYRVCNNERLSQGSPTERPRDDPISALTVFGNGADPPTFTVIERNGRWFISPIQTMLDSTVETLRAASPEDASSIADRFTPSIDVIVDLLGPPRETDPTTSASAPDATEETDEPERIFRACVRAIDRHDRRSRDDRERRDDLVSQCVDHALAG